MRRADRLFELIQLLRGRKLSTAQWLAERLEVSLRTVYRDIADLKLQGLPLEGEAGVGYRLRPGFDLAPLMFSAPEAEALVACVRLAKSRLDEGLAREAERGLSKIMAVLPEASRLIAEQVPLYGLSAPLDPVLRLHLAALRDASTRKRKVQMAYTDEGGGTTDRLIRPLGCFFWGAVWTLAAYCELRADFRHFRIDRVRALCVLDEAFADEPGKTLDDMRACVAAEDAARAQVIRRAP